MKYPLLREGEERTWAVIFTAGDEALAGLDQFARAESLDAARFTAIGGFARATLGYFDVVTESPGHLRRFDPEFGIALIDLAGEGAEA